MNTTEKHFHSSWLITAASIGLLIGTFLSLYIVKSLEVELLVIAICLSIIGFLRNGYLGLTFLLICGLLIGFWRGGTFLQDQTVLENFINQEVILSGIVADDPTYDTDGDLRLRLKEIVIDDVNYSGEVWISASDKPDVKRSDKVTVQGKLSSGFGTIPVAMYRANIVEITRADYADVARDVRDEFAQGIREGIQEPEASLGAGFLLGQKTVLPEKLDNELRLLGLTHIVVASGYNLTILIRFARRLFVKISRFSALALSGGLVYCFALVTGWSPSMTRAGLIAFLSLLAWYFGRKFHPVVLLSFSAALTVFINPTYAWGDIGWLLSFSSFVGVIILAPLIHAYFWGKDRPGSLRQVVIETLSAQVMTLPIIAYVFGQYSPLALPANVLILPLIPLAMLLTFFAGTVGVLVAPIAFIAGWPAETLMRYMTSVVDWLALSRYASSEVTIDIAAVLAMYLVLVSLIIFLQRRSKYPLREFNVIE